MVAGKPVIGITADLKAVADGRTDCEYRVKSNYAAAVAAAGGVPILIPPDALPADVVALVDGLLIPGGDDIDPKEYGQRHPEALLHHPGRFSFEAAIYRAAPSDLPILGICYGCQFINVMQGGTLIQHLPDVTGSVHTGGEMQRYVLEPGSKVAVALGACSVSGKSYHHQATLEPGRDVDVVGHSEDGTIEALEVTSRAWTIAVQWHPERTLEDPAMGNLFKSLVGAAAEYGARRSLAVV